MGAGGKKVKAAGWGLGVDELSADLGGGGHGCIVMLQRFLATPPGLGAFMTQR